MHATTFAAAKNVGSSNGVSGLLISCGMRIKRRIAFLTAAESPRGEVGHRDHWQQRWCKKQPGTTVGPVSAAFQLLTRQPITCITMHSMGCTVPWRHLATEDEKHQVDLKGVGVNPSCFNLRSAMRPFWLGGTTVGSRKEQGRYMTLGCVAVLTARYITQFAWHPSRRGVVISFLVPACVVMKVRFQRHLMST